MFLSQRRRASISEFGNDGMQSLKGFSE